MRRFLPPFLALTVAVLGGAGAGAQVTLVPGPEFPFSVGPKFVANADFNQDGLQDAVLTNAADGTLTVLFGSADGTFSSPLDVPAGRMLGRVAAGDLNGDRNPDIVTVDFLDSAAWVISGNGDGTFNPSASFPVGSGPVGVAIGNFDGQQGNDIVTADETIGKLTVLLNSGGNQGFTPLGDVDVGGTTPKLVAAADLNGDGFLDIVTINTGSADVDEVVVLLNNGIGGFEAPANVPVGAGANDMAVADLNNDGVPDIAVLNAGETAVLNTFSISILLNQTDTIGGRPVGLGSFDVQTPATITCPTTFDAILIQCNPNFVAAGDFDGDGFVDLAVSLATQPLIGGALQTPGLIQALAGHGDGTFEFGTQVSVGVDPQGLVAGDFTGDGLIDIAVAEKGSSTARIIRSGAPPLRGPESCNLGTQCLSGFCVDHICCDVAACPAGQFCNIPGGEGQCTAPAGNGNRCSNQTQCQSGFCIDDFCCGSASCQADQFCNTGECTAPAADGTPCSNDNGAQCNSGFCVDGVCCSTAMCPADQFCNIPGLEGRCAPPVGLGTACTVDAQCVSGHCTDSVCCAATRCGAGEACNIPGQEGQCTVRPSPTPRPTPTLTPSLTPTPQLDGAPCADDPQCQSQFCVDGVCCGARSCPAEQFCSISDSRGTCAPKKPNDQTCATNFDCVSDYCQPGSPSVCAPLPPPTLTPTLTQTGTPTPTPKPDGAPCDADDAGACASGFCTDDVCCDADSCPAPDRCDILGFKGTCSPRLLAGEACEKNTDCAEGILCLPDFTTGELFCSVPPTPTPTLFPTFTPTSLTTPGICVCSVCDQGLCHDEAAGGDCAPCLPPTVCAGDCKGTGSVTVTEILTMVSVALDNAGTCACPAGDSNNDCRITVNEILGAVNNVLTGCATVKVCGGTAGLPCAADEFCEFPSGTCGVADQAGECRPQPAQCDGTVAPVCGCDGLTYVNDCERVLGRVARSHTGPC